MGMTYVQMKLANPSQSERSVEQKFLVDSGAIYTVAPASLLAELGIKSHSKRTFTLADGSTAERQVGDALFEYEGRKAASPVIFGEAKDSNLLGTVTLEALGFILDPLQRELRLLPMQLVSLR